jgi:uncharacterized protein (UPF0335 family)
MIGVGLSVVKWLMLVIKKLRKVIWKVERVKREKEDIPLTSIIDRV